MLIVTNLPVEIYFYHKLIDIYAQKCYNEIVTIKINDI